MSLTENNPTPQVLEEEHDHDQVLKGLMGENKRSEENGFLKELISGTSDNK